MYDILIFSDTLHHLSKFIKNEYRMEDWKKDMVIVLIADISENELMQIFFFCNSLEGFKNLCRIH